MGDLSTVATGRPLGVGDAAPDFTLAKASGETVSLSDFRGRTEVVLYFYPRDNTAVCSAEACSFRDSFQDFRDAGAEVIGVSTDSSDSHRRFAERFRLPFILLSDPAGSVRARYGVPKTFGLIPGRTTFLIDKQGIIQRVFSSQFRPTKHASEALAALRKLRDQE
jgi:thioredoxin-dependent peroxiredoxin